MPAKPKEVRLSKSRVMKGMQCPKALYLSIHEPDLAGDVSAAQQRIFDQGHEVGLEAQKIFPKGTTITATHLEHQLALEQTQAAIKSGALAVFEATFQHEGVLVKIDILYRESAKAAWQIFEVKSATTVKEVHVQDVAVQLWVARACLPRVSRAKVMVVNNQCEFPHLEKLFLTEDVTEEAEMFIEALPELLAKLKKTAAAAKPPKQEIGPHCDAPYECAYKSHCWAGIKSPSVFDIPSLKTEKKWEYYEQGKIELKNLDPAHFSDKQARMIEYSVKNARFVDKTAIARELKWTYPLSFLDFETISFAIPRYARTRAYQQLPFQFSCHVRQKPGGKVEHTEYLHCENTDPREAVAEALTKLVPDTGSVVAFSKGVEGGILKKLAEEFPLYARKLKSIAERLVDPLPIFRAHVYDPAFHGSFSIKDVAPALLGKASGYEGLTVADGTAAQAAYVALIEATGKEKQKIAKDLIEYCTKDTMEMVLLTDWLFKQV